MDVNALRERNLFVLNKSAILGFINVSFLFILYLSGNLFSSWGYLSLLIYTIFTLKYSKIYRDNFFGGSIQYGKAFGFGFRLIALSGIISGFFYFILTKIDTELFAEQTSLIVDMFYQLGYPENMIEEYESILDKNLSLIMFLGIVFNNLFNGALISIFTSVFIKRNENFLTKQ